MSQETHTELQARIAALAGQINRHKQQPVSQQLARYGHHAGNVDPQYGRATARWAPYTRRAHVAFPRTVKNHTLVSGGGERPIVLDEDDDADPASQARRGAALASANFVSSRVGNRAQLMTKDTYEREQRRQQEYKQRRSTNPVYQSSYHPSRPAQETESTCHTARVLEFDGIKFELQFDGSKLVRLSDRDTSDKETPKKVKIADVEFLRTKSGNLIRVATTRHDKTRPDARASTKQCDKFTRYGTCPFGPSCKNRHDPDRIAICKDFFATGSCQVGRSCDLSHEPSYHRVPACIHFLRGNCTKSACRYAHVDVSASTLVCRPFATLGYCSKGVKCGNRHVFECPDYTNLGRCEAREKRACALHHIDHANTLRKAAKRKGRQKSEDGSDVSSDEEERVTEFETDDNSDIEITMGTDDSHQLTQQQDYVGFA